MIIFSYLANSIHDFLSITDYISYLPDIEKHQGMKSSALLAVRRWLHSSLVIIEKIRENCTSLKFHLPMKFSLSTYDVFSSDFFPDTRRNYRLILMYHWRLTLFIPLSLTQFCHLLPTLSKPTSSRLVLL